MTVGQSGSPVWVRRSDGNGSVYAINHAEFAAPIDNQGVRITQDIYNTLQNY
jgi:V8-like Glu-specific endopeptidase